MGGALYKDSQARFRTDVSVDPERWRARPSPRVGPARSRLYSAQATGVELPTTSSCQTGLLPPYDERPSSRNEGPSVQAATASVYVVSATTPLPSIVTPRRMLPGARATC